MKMQAEMIFVNFLPYFTYRHKITHMVLQVKLYPIMDETNNEKFCVERSTIYMYTCTDVWKIGLSDK
jgi:hypothetical protein